MNHVRPVSQPGRLLLLTACLCLCPAVVTIHAATAVITGTAWLSDCPSDPRMGMPCMLGPAVGCTVEVNIHPDWPQIMIWPPPLSSNFAVTGADGRFTIELDSVMASGAEYLVSAHKGDLFPWYTETLKATGSRIDTIDITIEAGSVVPPSPVGATSIINGTVYVTRCPPDPMTGMPCVMEPVARCTLTLFVSSYYYAEPMPYDTDPSTGVASEAVRAVTDETGMYSVTFDPPLAAGTEVTALIEQQGCYPYKNYQILAGDSIAVFDHFLDEGTPPPPPQPADFAAVTGTVTYDDPLSMAAMPRPVDNCTVFVYASYVPAYTDPLVAWGAEGAGAGSETVNPDGSVSVGVVYPDRPYPYMAITDASGRYTIDSIQIWSSDATLGRADFIVSAYKGGVGTAEAWTALTAGTTTTIDLELTPLPAPPVPLGQAAIAGSVFMRSCGNSLADTTCLLQPVPGCTVVVSAAFVPMMESAGDFYLPPVVEQSYTAVTDANGAFAISGIDLYSREYGVVVMAQKNGLFGTAYATLLIDQTVGVEVILDKLPYIIFDDGSGPDTVMSAEAAYYRENKDDAMPVVRPAGGGTGGVPVRSAAHLDGVRTLSVDLAAAQEVTVAAYALDGRLIAVVADRMRLGAGTHRVGLDALENVRGRAVLRVTGSAGLRAALRIPGLSAR